MDIAPTLTSIYGISADESWEGLPLVDETTVMLAKQWESQKGTHKATQIVCLLEDTTWIELQFQKMTSKEIFSLPYAWMG